MDSTSVPEELRCKYTQATCLNERAIKEDGERHNLCQHHRDKANDAQRRSAKKIRAEKRRKRIFGIAQEIAAQSGIPLEDLIRTEHFESEMREATHALYIETKEDHESGDIGDSGASEFDEEDLTLIKETVNTNAST